MLETAEIEIGRPHGHKIIVYNYHLAVKHPRLIEIHFDARSKAVLYI